MKKKSIESSIYLIAIGCFLLFSCSESQPSAQVTTQQPASTAQTEQVSNPVEEASSVELEDAPEGEKDSLYVNINEELGEDSLFLTQPLDKF